MGASVLTAASFKGLPFTIDKATTLDGLSTPSYDVSESVLAGVRGMRFNQALMRKRQVTLELVLCSSDDGDYFAQRQAILNACSKDAGEGELRLTVGGRDLLLYAVPEPPEITWPSQTGYFTALLQFFCYDPVIYEATSNTTSGVTVPTGGGFEFPVVFPIDFGESTGTGLFSLINAGNLTTYPVFTLEGPLTNPVITNRTTGEFFGLTYSLLEGQTVVIDMKARTVKRANGLNLAQFVQDGSTWFGLSVGVSQLRILTSSTANTGTLSAEWTNTYNQV